jgi:hypothetical protein
VARAVHVEDRVSPVKELYTFRRFFIGASWIFLVAVFWQKFL